MNLTDEEIDTALIALRHYAVTVRGKIKGAHSSEAGYLSRRALQSELLIQKLEMPQPLAHAELPTLSDERRKEEAARLKGYLTIELCKLCGGRHHHEAHRS